MYFQALVVKKDSDTLLFRLEKNIEPGTIVIIEGKVGENASGKAVNFNTNSGESLLTYKKHKQTTNFSLIVRLFFSINSIISLQIYIR